MATIEFPNTQRHTYLVARWCPSLSPQRIFAEPLSNNAHGTNWHGMGAWIDMGAEINPHECPEGDRRETRLRLNRSSRVTTVAGLSASIVNQLKEPLTSMLANAQAAKRWLAAEPPNLMEAIASIDRIARDVRAADKAMELIRALFEQESLDRREASIPDIMSGAVRLVLEDPNKREVPIQWHSDESLPKVWVDPVAIQTVFINLISNSIEALENNISPLVLVQAAVNDQNEVVIQVSDNGPGIGETEDNFDAFTTTKKAGMGIGLVVSRSIAEAHGGRLWAENNPSGGTKFCLALPLRSSIS